MGLRLTSVSLHVKKKAKSYQNCKGERSGRSLSAVRHRNRPPSYSRNSNIIFKINTYFGPKTSKYGDSLQKIFDIFIKIYKLIIHVHINFSDKRDTYIWEMKISLRGWGYETSGKVEKNNKIYTEF